MATRATYQINRTTFYCHWDGYPTGAAQRFANMVKALTVPETGDRKFDAIEDRRGGFEFAFIRGNLDAEPTKTHDSHGDTEYRYTVHVEPDGAAFMCCEAIDRDWSKGDKIVIRRLFFGDLADWLNKQRRELVEQFKRHNDRLPRGQTACDPEAEALACLPVIVRIDESREYGAERSCYYATASSRDAIASMFQTQGDGYKADNPNRAHYLKRAAEWRGEKSAKAA